MSLRAGRKLSYIEAYQELVAASCEKLLADGEAVIKVKKLASKDKPLVQKILDYLTELAKKIKTAYLGLSPDSLPGQIVGEMSDTIAELEELFAEALSDASVNFKNADGKRKSAVDNGGVMYSTSEESNNSSIKKQLREHLDEINAMNPVAEVSYEPQRKIDLKKNIIEEYRKIGFSVDRQGLGKILLDENLISKSLNYLNSDGEYAAFYVVPKVLKRGKDISEHKDHKGRAYGTITIAAPVKINGVIGNVAVIVRQTGKNRYHTHRILMPDGSEFAFASTKKAELTSADMLNTSVDQGTAIGSASNDSIPQNEQIVKGDEKKSQRSSVREDSDIAEDYLMKIDPNTIPWNKSKEELIEYQKLMRQDKYLGDVYNKANTELQEYINSKKKESSGKYELSRDKSEELKEIRDRIKKAKADITENNAKIAKLEISPAISKIIKDAKRSVYQEASLKAAEERDEYLRRKEKGVIRDRVRKVTAELEKFVKSNTSTLQPLKEPISEFLNILSYIPEKSADKYLEEINREKGILGSLNEKAVLFRSYLDIYKRQEDTESIDKTQRDIENVEREIEYCENEIRKKKELSERETKASEKLGDALFAIKTAYVGLADSLKSSESYLYSKSVSENLENLATSIKTENKILNNKELEALKILDKAVVAVSNTVRYDILKQNPSIEKIIKDAKRSVYQDASLKAAEEWDTYRKNREKTVIKDRIKKNAAELDRFLNRQTNKKRVLQGLKEPVANFLDIISYVPEKGADKYLEEINREKGILGSLNEKAAFIVL